MSNSEIQKLKELYEMGFIIEDEYLKRMEDLGAKVPKSAVQVQPDRDYNPYESSSINSSSFKEPKEIPNYSRTGPTTPFQPIESCSCSSFICTCGADVPTCLQEDHQAICYTATVSCPNKGMGCMEVLQKRKVAKHLAECVFAAVFCKKQLWPTIQFCNEELLRKDLYQHWKTVHRLLPPFPKIQPQNTTGDAFNWNSSSPVVEQSTENDPPPSQINYHVADSDQSKTEVYGTVGQGGLADALLQRKQRSMRAVQLEKEAREHAAQLLTYKQDDSHKIREKRKQMAEGNIIQFVDTEEEINSAWPCPLRSFGCFVELPRGEVSRHLAECPLNIIKCFELVDSGHCMEDIAIGDYEHHSHQPHRFHNENSADPEVGCPVPECPFKCKKSEMHLHFSNCPNYKLNCPSCKEEICIKDYATHFTTTEHQQQNQVSLLNVPPRQRNYGGSQMYENDGQNEE